MSDDLNLMVLCGQLAVEPEIRTFDSGAIVVRLLVSVTTDSPRRVDVIPAALYSPSTEMLEAMADANRGDRVWLCGSVQRRYWESPDGRRSRIEVVAEQVNFRVGSEELYA